MSKEPMYIIFIFSHNVQNTVWVKPEKISFLLI